MQTIIHKLYLTVLNTGEVFNARVPSGLSVFTFMSSDHALVYIWEPDPKINRGLPMEESLPDIAQWVIERSKALGGHTEVEPVVVTSMVRVNYVAHPVLDVEQQRLIYDARAMTPVREGELGRYIKQLGLNDNRLESEMEETAAHVQSFLSSKTARSKSVFRVMTEIWEEIFNPALPLKLGISEDIIRDLPYINPEDIHRALSLHCSTSRYRSGLVDGHPRYGLDGGVHGSVEMEEGFEQFN